MNIPHTPTFNNASTASRNRALWCAGRRVGEPGCGIRNQLSSGWEISSLQWPDLQYVFLSGVIRVIGIEIGIEMKFRARVTSVYSGW